MSLSENAKTLLGRRILLNVRPPANRRHDEKGHCRACGLDTTFVFNSWVIPTGQFGDPATTLAYTRRESMFCKSCCSSLRVRRIAEVLLSLYGTNAKSLAELLELAEFRQLQVAEINTIGALGSLHQLLARHPNLSLSEYRGANGLGTNIDGIRNEDICRLTYPDASFDLVLSSDTLEHVSDYRAALRETRRVLRPGGRHIFTVPVDAKRAKSYARVEIQIDGQLIHRVPPLYHGRGSGLYRFIPVGNDLLTYTEFGLDLERHMREAGFDTKIARAVADDQSGATFVFIGTAPSS